MTDEKVNDQRPTPGPHARWRISAETLAATRSNPPAVLAEFVGFTAEDSGISTRSPKTSTHKMITKRRTLSWIIAIIHQM